MPPFVAHAFWPLRTHSSVASSYFARVRRDGDVGAGVRLGDAEGADLRVVGACRSTAGSTRRSARRVPLAKMPATASVGAHDRHADAGVAPEQLLVDDRQRQAGRVGEELRERLEAVEADLRGLLDDRPGRLLALVPLGRGRAHDVLGEAVDPVAHVLLVLGQLERERRLAGLGQLDGSIPWRRIPFQAGLLKRDMPQCSRSHGDGRRQSRPRLDTN